MADLPYQNSVAEGGTGQVSLTAYAVLAGGTTSTSPIQSIASVGTAAQVLTSNGAGALPTFQDAAGGGVSGPGSSTDNALARWNGTDGDTLQDSTVVVSDNGEMTNASQPAFLGYVGTTISNCTGNGTTYILGDTDIGAALTEVFDQNSDFVAGSAAGAIFTAPVTGRYQINFNMRMGSISTSTQGYYLITTSNLTYNLCTVEPQNVADSGGLLIQSGSVFVDMDASDTCTMSVTFTGEGADTLDIAANNGATTFSGYLVC